MYNIDFICNELGTTQKGLAELIGVSTCHLSNYARNKKGQDWMRSKAHYALESKLSSKILKAAFYEVEGSFTDNQCESDTRSERRARFAELLSRLEDYVEDRGITLGELGVRLGKHRSYFCDKRYKFYNADTVPSTETLDWIEEAVFGKLVKKADTCVRINEEDICNYENEHNAAVVRLVKHGWRLSETYTFSLIDVDVVVGDLVAVRTMDGYFVGTVVGLKHAENPTSYYGITDVLKPTDVEFREVS